jgi:hypothetical protein
VAGADPETVEPDPSASASCGGGVAADAVDGRVSPGGVSGANPGVWGAADSWAVALVEFESMPNTEREDAAACEVGVEVGEVNVGAEVELAVAAVIFASSSGAALNPLRRNDWPLRFAVPRPLAALEPLPFEASLRCTNKPSKNAKRGCDGAICRSLSTSVRAPLKSSDLRAASVCATKSTTSCEYCGA